MPRFYKQDGSEVAGLREARKVNAVPSVTTIINGSAPHEYKYLEDKRLMEVLDSELSREEKLEILGNKPVFEAGTIVHEASEIYLDTSVRSTVLNCPVSSKQLYNWLDTVNPLHVEVFLNWKEAETAGRADLIAELEERVPVIDIKTVAEVKKKPTKSWILQLGAYASAALENDIQTEGGIILQFSKKDKGCFPLEISNELLAEGARVFRELRSAYRFYYGI